VRDLLSFSRITTRGDTLGPTDANACLKAALNDLEMVITDSGARIRCDRLPSVIVDESQLTCLFENLIGNAIKYRSDDAPEIHISGRDLGNQFEFSVSDNGIGIDPQCSERIFQVFQRLHDRNSYSGTGIGLALCKRIVQRFGGAIWVKSKPGCGSTFYFTVNKSKPAIPGQIKRVDSVSHYFETISEIDRAEFIAKC